MLIVVLGVDILIIIQDHVNIIVVQKIDMLIKKTISLLSSNYDVMYEVLSRDGKLVLLFSRRPTELEARSRVNNDVINMAVETV